MTLFNSLLIVAGICGLLYSIFMIYVDWVLRDSYRVLIESTPYKKELNDYLTCIKLASDVVTFGFKHMTVRFTRLYYSKYIDLIYKDLDIVCVLFKEELSKQPDGNSLYTMRDHIKGIKERLDKM